MKKVTKKLTKHLKKIGRLGGSSTSPAKAKAAAENGKKGGRPRKKIASGAA
jgi:general stress protein YciG